MRFCCCWFFRFRLRFVRILWTSYRSLIQSPANRKRVNRYWKERCCTLIWILSKSFRREELHILVTLLAWTANAIHMFVVLHRCVSGTRHKGRPRKTHGWITFTKSVRFSAYHCQLLPIINLFGDLWCTVWTVSAWRLHRLFVWLIVYFVQKRNSMHNRQLQREQGTARQKECAYCCLIHQ